MWYVHVLCGCVHVCVCGSTDVPFWSQMNASNCSRERRAAEMPQWIRCVVLVMGWLAQEEVGGLTRCVMCRGNSVCVCVCVRACVRACVCVCPDGMLLCVQLHTYSILCVT